MQKLTSNSIMKLLYDNGIPTDRIQTRMIEPNSLEVVIRFASNKTDYLISFTSYDKLAVKVKDDLQHDHLATTIALIKREIKKEDK